MGDWSVGGGGGGVSLVKISPKLHENEKKGWDWGRGAGVPKVLGGKCIRYPSITRDGPDVVGTHRTGIHSCFSVESRCLYYH